MVMDIIKDFYEEHPDGALNDELYKFFEELIGDYVNKQFKHDLRNDQQQLKKQKWLERTGYKTWRKVKTD